MFSNPSSKVLNEISREKHRKSKCVEHQTLPKEKWTVHVFYDPLMHHKLEKISFNVVDHFHYFLSALTVSVTLEMLRKSTKSGLRKTVDTDILTDSEIS